MLKMEYPGLSPRSDVLMQWMFAFPSASNRWKKMALDLVPLVQKTKKQKSVGIQAPRNSLFRAAKWLSYASANMDYGHSYHEIGDNDGTWIIVLTSDRQTREQPMGLDGWRNSLGKIEIKKTRVGRSFIGL